MTENQINEIFRLMNKAITKIDGLEIKVDNLENKFDEAEERNEKFRQEAKESFDEINQKLRFMNNRAEVVVEDLLQTKYRVRDVEKRLDNLEQKEAA